MSRDKGNRAAAWVAAAIRPWFPLAEALPNGRPGADIENTPAVAFEVKTGAVWRDTWLAQAKKYEGLSILVYLGPKIGEANVMHAQTVVPLHVMMQLLKEAGYC